MSQLPFDKENLFLLLSQDPRPYEIVPFPRKVKGKEFNVAMVILTALENAQCKAEAEKKAQQFLKEAAGRNQGYDELYNDFSIVNLLWHATRFENDISKQFFPTKDSILETLSTDEIAILQNNYHSLLLHKGPIIADFTKEDLDLWLERIITDGVDPRFLFNSVSVEGLKIFAIGVVKELKIARMEKSSSGGQQESII